MKTKDWEHLTLFLISVLVYFPFAHWISTTPVGTDIFLWGAIVYASAGFVAVVAIPVSLVMLCFKRRRRYAFLALMLSLIYLPLAFYGIALGMHVRMARMTDFAERSQPLIDAINQYVDDHSEPPESLEQLVPEYLPAVPGTGMMAYPEYEYDAGAEARKRFQENPWVLVVNTPSGGINWDQMFYFPRQNYDEVPFSAGLERVGDWAYNHE